MDIFENVDCICLKVDISELVNIHAALSHNVKAHPKIDMPIHRKMIEIIGDFLGI